MKSATKRELGFSYSSSGAAIWAAIQVAQREVPEDQLKRRAELEATTYSTETGEKSAEGREQKRRPTRKKRALSRAR